MTASSTIFFAKSKYCPKDWFYDHVGFITNSGTLIQVSGHRRGDGVYKTQKLADDPVFDNNELRKINLGKTVIIPDIVPTNIQNCTMFVSNITGIPNENIIETFKTGDIKKIVNDSMSQSPNQLNEGFLELYQQIRQSSPRLFFDAQKITTLIAKASSKGYSAEKTWPYLKRLEDLLGGVEGFKRPSDRIMALFLFAKLTKTEERKNAMKFYRDVLEAGRAKAEITDLIKECVLLELAKAEADADDPYGEYLFATNRLDLVRPDSDEENTEQEDDLEVALANHYSNQEYGLGALAPKIFKLLSKGKYTKILAPPEDASVYRIIGSLEPKLASKILGVPMNSIIRNPNVIKKSVGGVMKPGGAGPGSTKIHSWTTKLEMSWIYSDLFGMGQVPIDDRVFVILKSNTELGKFFINPAEIENVTSMPDFAYRQNEVISYGPVPFNQAVYVYCAKSKDGKFVQFKYLLDSLISAAK